MNKSHLLFGYSFKDKKKIRISDLDEAADTEDPIWLHFDFSSDETEDWLTTEAKLSPHVINALVSDETRPRATHFHDGVLISLRGVNLSPNSDPEDMVSIRLWLEENLIISAQRRKLLSVTDIIEELEQGKGPQTPVQFVIRLTEQLIIRMADTINDIEEKVSEIEEDILLNYSFAARSELNDLRKQIISLRRYLYPQRDAMQQLLSEKITFFNSDEKIQLREIMDQLMRYIEDLDSVRDRATVAQEEVNNRLSEQLNSRMYVLSIVAAIFLPLGFLTGLLGINVGGIPGAENSNAFNLFLLFLAVIVVVQIWLFKKNKWF